MALDSVPPYPSDLGSSRAVKTQKRIRKGERTWTTNTFAPYDDGHQWRKYGEKKLSNSNFPRFYYRCTYKNEMKCPATKQVQQQDTSDPPLFSVTYFNHHTCSSNSANPIGSTRDVAAQISSKKAVSICFSPHGSSEQPTFLTSSATPQSPSIHSYRTNQQTGMSAYAPQFQWTGTSSPTGYGPVNMEVDDISGASASSSSTGALSRTLLTIGQSRCIEYFHFL
uniref:WRKY domain-containing protein n=1 Tax=Arundo donax TaxID=35708 RepID=A0A0A8YGX9_ARUDO